MTFFLIEGQTQGPLFPLAGGKVFGAMIRIPTDNADLPSTFPVYMLPHLVTRYKEGQWVSAKGFLGMTVVGDEGPVKPEINLCVADLTPIEEKSVVVSTSSTIIGQRLKK